MHEVSGAVDWDELAAFDVVVGLPNSLSPTKYETEPPRDFFDLVVVDEAHHTPAETWRSLLEHFDARALLLTATPIRRDKKRLPGKQVYHYPLRKALDEGLYQPVDAVLLEANDASDRAENDRLIGERVVAELARQEHRNSLVLIRASTIQRAKALAHLYEQLGVPVTLLHSRLSKERQTDALTNLRELQVRGVAVVGMLTEGFDLPALRIAAYHDKHKSIPATAQLIGRLARVHGDYPQASTVVTVKDIDVFPELKGRVRSLYEEDSDWARVLPSLLDDVVEEESKDNEYLAAFTPAASEIRLDAIHPTHRIVFWQARGPWQPTYSTDDFPRSLRRGDLFQGQRIRYSGLSGEGNHLVVVTEQVEKPKWFSGNELDRSRYRLFVASYQQSPSTKLPDLLLINARSDADGRQLKALLDPEERLELADPEDVQLFVDGLTRLSTSNIGLRSQYGGMRGALSYKILSGRDLERGNVAESDTAGTSLGHAMLQITDGSNSFGGGVSTGKAKYWELRHSSLRGYDEFVTDLTNKYWYPPTTADGPLLPQVGRGRRFSAWPESTPLLIDLDEGLLSGGWTLPNGSPMHSLELRVRDGWNHQQPDLEIEAIALDKSTVWIGTQSTSGVVRAEGSELFLSRGFSYSRPFSDLLLERPPTIYFSDGTTIRGRETFEQPTPSTTIPLTRFEDHDWEGVDIFAETRATALRKGTGRSINEELERLLEQQTPERTRRWILENDGAGEIADYIVIDARAGNVEVQLWHAKGAGGAPAVRVSDMQVVVAQAIKSRRWITDTRFWNELGDRVEGTATPRARLVSGDRDLLLALCGKKRSWSKWSYDARRQRAAAEIWIAQPGLSRSQLEAALSQADPPTSAMQVRDLLAVFHDASQVARRVGILCSS